MLNQNSVEILDEIMEVLRNNSIKTIKIPQNESLGIHSGVQDNGSSEISYDTNLPGSIQTCNNTIPSAQCEKENFDPQSLRIGDMIMISIIIAAVQSHLIPTFDITMDTIKYHESNTTVTDTATATQYSASDPTKATSFSTSSENIKTKNIFPSLSFTDARNSFCLTFSTVSVFGEIVVYSSQKKFNEIKIKKQNKIENQAAGKDAVNIGNAKKKKIQTLYLNPDNFISFSPSVNNDVINDCRENNNKNGDIEKYDENDKDNDNTGDSKNHNSEKTQNITKFKNTLSCVQIGTYTVKLSVLTSRITKALLDPFLIEK